MQVPILLTVTCICFIIVNGVSGNVRDLANEKSTSGSQVSFSMLYSTIYMNLSFYEVRIENSSICSQVMSKWKN